MTTINYGTAPGISDVGNSVVYTKSTWAGSWVEQPNLICTECQWQAAPQFSSALLVWRTGYIIMPGDTTPTLFGPWTGRGHFVRIDWQCEDDTILRWVGYIDSSGWPTDAFGDQPIVCYGLDRALALTPIIDHAWKQGTDILRSAFSPDFDYNRSEDPDDDDVYVFYDPIKDDAGLPWTTRQIVEYLLKYQLPTSNFGVANIPWAVNQLTQLPDWDRPIVETRNRTVWDVLCDLVNGTKQLGMTVGSNGSTAFLRFFTHTASTITVGSHTLAANPNQHTIVFGSDPLTNASLTDVGGGYDQVICRGDRRKSICTLVHGTSLANGWESADETTYEAGASGDAGYTALNTDDQRARNASKRSSLYPLNTVYRRFVIKDTFDWMIEDEEIFPDNPTPRTVEIALRAPVVGDWTTVDEADYDRNAMESLPLVMTHPDISGKSIDLRYFALWGETITNADRPHDLRVSAEAKRLGEKPELWLNTAGAPAHALAKTTFSKLPVDLPYGGLDYTTMKATVMLLEDRHVEGKYPTSSPSADVVRRLVVDCGPEYQQIHVHAGTIVDLDPDGTPRTVGTAAYLVDDSDKLKTLAQIIALGAVLTRKRASWQSLRRISTIAVGDLITSAAGATVLAPVTSIRISAPMSINRPASCPTQSFETYTGQQDPLAVLRNLGMEL